MRTRSPLSRNSDGNGTQVHILLHTLCQVLPEHFHNSSRCLLVVGLMWKGGAHCGGHHPYAGGFGLYKKASYATGENAQLLRALDVQP